MAKRPTTNDIAAACGLSIFTVSKALNDASGVSPTSRKKVLDAARTLGYVPHTAARALRTQAPGPVIVLTASTSNYYYIDLLDGLQEGLREAGLPVRIVDLAPAGRFDTTVEADAVQEAMQARATGVISTLSLTPQNYERLNDWGIPVVFVDSDPPGPSPAPPRSPPTTRSPRPGWATTWHTTGTAAGCCSSTPYAGPPVSHAKQDYAPRPPGPVRS